ncbi:hypothetical protein BDV93DRAFT_580492 [Ceratobasidium sp. AG-I]|nr:hypothetical protein BDV93DRAFT_580492 [Ceratobasidium sp. AG-I]
MHLVLGYFDLDAASSRPLLRIIPRQGAIIKFLEAWDTRATYEEQVEAAVTEIMARGITDETMELELDLYSNSAGYERVAISEVELVNPDKYMIVSLSCLGRRLSTSPPSTSLGELYSDLFYFLKLSTSSPSLSVADAPNYLAANCDNHLYGPQEIALGPLLTI